MYQFGRLLQLAGLVILPMAILLELESQLTLWKSLAMSAFGILLFSIGYIASAYGTK